MKNILIIVFMSAVTASAAVMIWQSATPDAIRSVQLCERLYTLEFDQKTTRWVELAKPLKSVVVCAIAGTTQELKVQGLRQPYTDTPLKGKMLDVDCFKSAHIKTAAPPVQMPDGLYCNIPQVVR